MRKRKQQITRSKSGKGHGSKGSLVEEGSEEVIRPPENGQSEYERERLLIIEENKARMEALGLPKMASSFAPNRALESGDKAELNGSEEDEDYNPNLDVTDEDDSNSSSQLLVDDDDYVHGGSSKAPFSAKKSRAKKKVAVHKKQKLLDNLDSMDQDEALKKAIAFSLKDSRKGCGALNESSGKVRSPQLTGRKKGRKLVTNRVGMNEDDVVIHFCQLDEAGKGSITVRDLERMATSHDFTWTDKELMDMIQCFDRDGDGKLTMEDFRNIVVRCNLLRTSEDA